MTAVPFDDDLLLALLEVVIGDSDPVPPDVVATARAMFGLRSLEAGANPPDT